MPNGFELFDRLTYNNLTEQVSLINEELIHKTHALSVDQKCLEYRSQLDGIKEDGLNLK